MCPYNSHNSLPNSQSGTSLLGWMSPALALTTAAGNRWIKDIEAYTPDAKVDYPIIADADKKIATLCACLWPAPASSMRLPLACHPEVWLNSVLSAVWFGNAASLDQQILVALLADRNVEAAAQAVYLNACLFCRSCCAFVG